MKRSITIDKRIPDHRCKLLSILFDIISILDVEETWTEKVGVSEVVMLVNYR